MRIYSIRYSPQARRFLHGLERKTATAVLRKIEKVAANPFQFLDHYEGQGYKLRIGKLRALVDIDTERQLILVRVIDKRDRIYK